MPKVLQCANCKKYFLGGTYTLIKHFEKCILENKTVNAQDAKKSRNVI